MIAIIRRIFRRDCECGHSPEAHLHYSRSTACSLCPCERFR